MIIPDLQKSCKYTTQNAYILFTLLPLKLTSSMVQLSNPDNLHWCNNWSLNYRSYSGIASTFTTCFFSVPEFKIAHRTYSACLLGLRQRLSVFPHQNRDFS